MKCPLCEKRKSRRSCPAKNTVICAQCCGEKRILEIDCPEGCEYLKVGRNHEANLESQRHLQFSDPVKRQKHYRVLDRHEEVLVSLELLIAQERRVSRNLTDGDLAEALDLLLGTLVTEEKGLLYERTSANLKIEALRRQLRDVIQSFRYPEDSTVQQRLLLRDAIECLEFIRDMVASHMEAGRSSMSFVDFLARHMPRVEKEEGLKSSIIIPGR